MKKIIFSLSALAALLLAGSCQRENLEPVEQGGTVTYTVQVPQDIATKATGDGFTLYYEVYRKGDVTNLDADPVYEGTKAFSDGKADVQLEFVKDQEFYVLFWAQQTTGAQAYNIDDLRNVSLSTLVANDLTAEVFAGNDHVVDCKSDKDGNVVLVRPVAQLNIATTAESFTLGTTGSTVATVVPTQSKVVVNGLYGTYNVADGTVDTKASRTYTKANVTGSDFKNTYKLMATNYLGFIPQAGDNVEVTFTIYTEKDGNIEHTVSNVPVKANYQTNILGNLISATADYQVTLEDWADAGKDMEVLADGIVKNINGDYEISTAKGLAYAICNVFANGGTFYVLNNIDMTGVSYDPADVPAGTTVHIVGEAPVVTRSSSSVVITGLTKPLLKTVQEGAAASFANIYIEAPIDFVQINNGVVAFNNCDNTATDSEDDLVGDNTNGTIAEEGTNINNLALEKALAANASSIKLAGDITASEIIVVDYPVTIDGCGHKLTSTAGRAINVSGADGVTIKNLVIECSGERAINIIQNATNVTIDNVTATAANYTVNVAGSAPGAVVNIKNSTLNGLCTVNVSAEGADVRVSNSTVNCNDNNTTLGEVYSALSLNKEAVGGKIIATNTVVNVTEGSDSHKGRNGAENGVVTINDSTDDVVVMVAAIIYPDSDYYYAFVSLDGAIDFAQGKNGVVTLIRNLTVAEPVTIEDDQTVVLDLNGYTITAGESGYAIENYGELTIIDSKGNGEINGIVYGEGDSAKTIIEGGTYNALENGSYVFLNSQAASLTINGATINGGASYPIYSYDASSKLVINDATVNATFGCVNAYGTGGTVEINGGTFNMTGVQGKTSHIAYFSNVDAVINGGTFNKIGDINMSSAGGGGICAIYGAALTINNGTFAGDYADVYNWGGTNKNDRAVSIAIKGGIYKFKPTFLAEGYKDVKTAAGYTVIPDAAVFAADDSAVEAALDNPNINTIYLDAKEYTIEMYTNFAEKESLTIIGTEGTKVKFANQQVRLQLAKNFTIKNCEILHMATKSWGMLVFGGRNSGAVNCTVSNCSFKGVGTQGIYINENISGAVYNIENCTFDGDFGSADGAVTIQNNHGVKFTVNVTGCTFNTDSKKICYLYDDPAFKLNTDPTVTPVCLNR